MLMHYSSPPTVFCIRRLPTSKLSLRHLFLFFDWIDSSSAWIIILVMSSVEKCSVHNVVKYYSCLLKSNLKRMRKSLSWDPSTFRRNRYTSLRKRRLFLRIVEWTIRHALRKIPIAVISRDLFDDKRGLEPFFFIAIKKTTL